MPKLLPKLRKLKADIKSLKRGNFYRQLEIRTLLSIIQCAEYLYDDKNSESLILESLESLDKRVERMKKDTDFAGSHEKYRLKHLHHFPYKL